MRQTKKVQATDGQSEPQKMTGNKYVTRYRRTKNLIKKCADISQQCELEIVMVIYDRKNDRMREVHTSKNLTLNDLHRMVLHQNKTQAYKYKKEYIGPEIDEPNESDCLNNLSVQLASEVVPDNTSSKQTLDENIYKKQSIL